MPHARIQNIIKHELIDFNFGTELEIGLSHKILKIGIGDFVNE